MATFSSDDFSDPGGTSLSGKSTDTGGTWTIPTWGAAVGAVSSANRAHGGSSSSAFEAVGDDPATLNYSVLADLVYTGFSGINPVGVLGRSVSGNGYALYRGNTNIQLQRITAGSGVAIATLNVAYADCRVELHMLGNQISAFVQDTATGQWVTPAAGLSATRQACLSVVDATHTAKGVPGIYLNNSLLSTRVHLDNFAATEADTFTESVDSTLSLSQSVEVKIYRRPLHLSRSGDRARIAQVGMSEFIGNVDPDLMGWTSLLNDTADATYYYYGGLQSDGSWRINRYLISDLNSKTVASQANNPSYTSLSAAWTDRASLSYA